MVVALVLMGIAGLLVAMRVGSMQRVTVWLATGGGLLWAQWLLASLLSRTIITAVLPAVVFVSVGSAVLLLSGIGWWRGGRPLPLFVWQREWPVIVVTLIVMLGAAPILIANQWHTNTWTMHGFYNGDTATFIALVERSLREAGLVATNPFADNGFLEYPTLIHAGVADLLRGVTNATEWLGMMPWLVMGQIALTIPLLFGSMDLLVPQPTPQRQEWVGWWRPRTGRLIEMGMVGYILLLAWDMYVYPQSHFFITNLFILAVLFFQQAWSLRTHKQLAGMVVVSVIVLLLLLSNAVTGTAAVVLMLVFCGGRASDRSRAVWERVFFLLIGLAWVGLFILLPPGEGALGWPTGFSYTAVPDMLRLGVVVAPLLAAVIWRARTQPFIAVGVGALLLVALITFVFSQREIVVENASRFFYHALLAGWPLLLYPLTRIWVWLRRELWYTSHTAMEAMAVSGATVVGLVLLLLPALASTASTYDNLLRRNEQTVSADMFEALRWLDAMSEMDVVVAASPVPPFAVPLVTGRALLRTDYWLSPDDALGQQVIAAFAGDTAAQAVVQERADYLLLTRDQRAQWSLGQLPVFENTTVAIYEL